MLKRAFFYLKSLKISKRELLSEKFTNESTFYALILNYHDFDVSPGVMTIGQRLSITCRPGVGISVFWCGCEEKELNKFFPEPVEDNSRISLSIFSFNFLNAFIPFPMIPSLWRWKCIFCIDFDVLNLEIHVIRLYSCDNWPMVRTEFFQGFQKSCFHESWTNILRMRGKKVILSK